MRVVGGIAKGRNLKSVPGDSTRPILDRVKTALFDILRPEIQGKFVLDLFGGTGNVGIEAISQGAAHCTFLDIEKKAIDTINDNLSTTNLSKFSKVYKQDCFMFLKTTKQPYDLIYIAPPQYKNIWVEVLQMISAHPNLVTDNGKLIVQIDPLEYEHVGVTNFEEYDSRIYGNTQLIFYRKIK